MIVSLMLASVTSVMSPIPRHMAADCLSRFWKENDGKTVRRLPVGIAPENVFWSLGTRDFSDGLKAFDRLVDEGLSKSTYNCITLTLRCNPELGDAETIAAAKRCIEKAHADGSIKPVVMTGDAKDVVTK